MNKKTLALIILAPLSKSLHSVGKLFRRCKEHGNVMCYGGRALEPAEFNKVAPSLIHMNSMTSYGMLPQVQLVEVEIPDEETAPPTPDGDATPPGAAKTPEASPVVKPNDSPVSAPVPPVALPDGVVVEAVDGGFVLGDYRDGAVFAGANPETGWAADISLVQPFATEDEAKAGFLKASGLEAPKGPAEKVEETTTTTTQTEAANSTGAAASASDATPPAASTTSTSVPATAPPVAAEKPATKKPATKKAKAKAE